MKRAVRKAFGLLGYSIVHNSTYDQCILEASRCKSLMLENQAFQQELGSIHPYARLWSKLDSHKRETISTYLPLAYSQFGQDLFVISELGRSPDCAYFVEFGSTDGLRFSNTCLLEKHLNWTGILAEPARVWHKQLVQNRTCHIDFRCVTDITGEEIEFFETLTGKDDFFLSSPELSSIAKFADNGDWASEMRMKNSLMYNVPTVSLNDLLLQYDAPKEIGYLSLDTEGSELMILEGFDFTRYRIHVITVEHNFNYPIRDSINQLLVSIGYDRIFSDISAVDDWYVLR